MAEKVQVELEVLANKAIKSIDDFSAGAQKKLSQINLNSFVAGAAGALAIGKAVFDTVGSAIEASIGAAIEAEEATAKLANSMRLVGGFSDEALASMEAFANELARTTTLSDDQVTASLALAKSFSLTNKEAKSVVAAAADLSAITGDTLDSSVEKLSKTFNGFISRELKQLAPELAGLTKAQLEAGAAVDVLAGKFSGSAANQAKTFGGSLSNLTKALGELAEEFGRSVTENEGFKKSINGSTAAVYSFSEAIAEINKDPTSKKFYDDLDERVKGLRKAYIGAEDSARSFLEESKRVARLGQAAKAPEAKSEKEIQEQRRLIAFREKAEEDYQRIRVDLETIGLSEVAKINQDAAKKIKTVRDAATAGNPEAVRKQEEFIAAIRIDQAKKLSVVQAKIRAEGEAAEIAFEKQRRDRVEGISREPFTEVVNLALGKIDTTNAPALIAGIGNTILQGASGAQKAISSVIGGIADTLLPGIGGVVSSIVDTLAQGPEKVREMIRGFVQAIPQIIVNIVESIPVLIEELVNAVPVLIEKLIAAIPQLINGLIKELPKLGVALALQAPKIAIAFVKGLIENIPQLIQGFVQGLINAAGEFVNALIDAINPFSGGGGGGGGPISGLGIPVVSDLFGAIGLADGGRIPDLPQYAGDRFPARLDAGEQVLDRDLSNRLEQFLSGGGGSAPTQVVIRVGQQDLAKVLLDLNRGGFRTA